MNLELYMPPSLTTTVQLYTRGGAATGSVISGTPDSTDTSLYRYSLTGVSMGDYDAQLLGVSTPNGPKFAMRVVSSLLYYISDYWYLIDATVVSGFVIIPSGVAGMCNVQVAVRRGGTAIQNATVTIMLDEINNTINDVVISRTAITGVTDVSGLVTIALVRYVTFTDGGIYWIRIHDTNGIIMFNKRMKVTDAASANLEDLVEVT